LEPDGPIVVTGKLFGEELIAKDNSTAASCGGPESWRLKDKEPSTNPAPFPKMKDFSRKDSPTLAEGHIFCTRWIGAAVEADFNVSVGLEHQ